MQERLQSAFSGLMEKWKSFTKKQQWIIIGITVGVILSLTVAIFIITRPKWEVLYTNIGTDEMTLVQATLEENQIAWQYGSNERIILVQQKDLKNARYKVSNVENSALSGLKFADALGLITMSTTGKVQDEILLKTRKSEIESMLAQRDDIVSATVTIDLPKDSNFYINADRRGTAQVLLNTGVDRLTRKDGDIIANMVAANFMDLKKEDVYVSDTAGNILYAGVEIDSVTGTLDARLEIQSIRENELSNKMIEKISKLLKGIGDGGVSVAPNLVFDWTDSDISEIAYTNPDADGTNKGFVLNENVKKESGTAGNTDAEPGLAENDLTPGANLIGNATAEEINANHSILQYGYNSRQIQTSDNKFGTVMLADSSCAVHIYTNKYYNEATMTPVDLGNMSWEAFKAQNGGLVKTGTDEEILASLKAASGLTNVNLVTFDTPVFIDKIVTPIDFQSIIIFGILAVLLVLLAFGIIRRTQPDEITEIEPELSVEDLLVSTQLEEEKESAEARFKDLAEIEFGQDSEVKKQIEKFVDEKPEAVAQLLRNWLNEDWE